jgi:citrate lyase subunit beta/citryl-CoA lyase
MSHCYLFVPGHRSDRFAKAQASQANFIIIDLEDAVAPQDKTLARNNAVEWLANPASVRHQTIVRINGWGTEYFAQDVQALRDGDCAAIMVPKVESDHVLQEISSQLQGRSIPLIPIIESALGLLHVQSIAQAHGVERLAFGSVDFQLDTGIPSEGQALLFARSSIVIASAAAQLKAPIDGVTVQLDDASQLHQDIQYAKSLGFGAKLCIHPSQVSATLTGFQPTPQEVDWAREVCQASQEAMGNAVRLHGKLIDLPVVLRAKRILADLA